MWRDLLQDVGYALRLLGRARGFTTVAVLTLALGVGATTAIFSIIDAALLRPLPYPRPEQLVHVYIETRDPNNRVARYTPSNDDVDDWRADTDVFAHVTIWRDIFSPIVVDGPEPERVKGKAISEDYLALHSVVPSVGREFDANDMREGAAPVILLGHGYWRSRFGGDPAALGQSLRLDNIPATIVGVLPPSFYSDTPIWRPFHTTGHRPDQRGSGATVYARLRPGVTIEEARRRLTDMVVARAAGEGLDRVSGVQITSLYQRATSGYWSTTKILSYAVSAILLIACVNVAGLLLARGATRGPELGIRASLGAGRGRLVRQLLAESLVLSLAGGAAGALLAWLSLDVVVANIPLSLPANSPPTLNLRVLGFTLSLSLLTGLLFGLAPAVRMSRVSLANVLSESSQRHGSALSRRWGQTLIAVEVAMAIVLLAGAGLMIRSFARVMAVDVGFDPRRVMTMEVEPMNPDPEVLRQYYPALVEALRGRPGVEAAGAVDHMPLASGSTVTTARVGGDRVRHNGAPLMLHVREFVAGYFETVGFSLTSGRFPADADMAAGLPAAMLNASAARAMFPGNTALGRTFEMGKRTYQVLGVVRDVRHSGPLSKPAPEVYLPFGLPGSSGGTMIVAVRSSLGLAAMTPLLREAASAPGPRVVVHQIRQGSDWLGDRVVTPRRRTVLLGLLGALGFILTLVGIFGTTAYAVGRRTREIGVRMALGARPPQVVSAILRDALWPTLVGIVIGIGAASMATRVIASFLFETPPIHVATFVVVAITMTVASGLAAWFPARRAAMVDPVEALRVG
jgi:predicted permease